TVTIRKPGGGPSETGFTSSVNLFRYRTPLPKIDRPLPTNSVFLACHQQLTSGRRLAPQVFTMTTLWLYLRYGLRNLALDPALTAVALLTIGIGIGANTTVFSWIRALLLNPLPGAVQPERIVAIENTASDGEPLTTSYLDFRDFRDNLHLVNFVTARLGNVFSIGDAPDTAAQVWGEMVSAGFFD